MAANEFASIVVPTNIINHEEVIDIYTYLSTRTSPPNKQTQPPLWISSSSERKHTLKSKNASSNSSTNSGIKQSGNDGILQEQIQPKNPTKEKLLQYLKNISGKNTFAGVLFESIDTDRNETVEVIHRITGVHPGIITIKMPSYSAAVYVWQSFTDEIIAKWYNGYLVHIVWWSGSHPFIHLNMRDAFQGQWNNLINDNRHLNKVWKKHLDAIVPYFQQLQNAGVVVICDFFPMLNNRVCLWGGRPGMNGSLRLYQITHDYMTQQHNLHSLLWTLSVSCDCDIAILKDFWPGNIYVDVASAYFWCPEEIEMTFYRQLLDVVGDTPISMAYLMTPPSPPSPKVLALQPRWIWFTTQRSFYKSNENNAIIKKKIESDSIINKENNEFFKTLMSNQ